MSHIPTADELRARGDSVTLDMVLAALDDHVDAIAKVEKLAMREGRAVRASEREAAKAHSDHVVDLRKMADNMRHVQENGTVRERIGRTGAWGGSGTQADYRKLDALAPEHSMREWVQARQGKPEYDIGEAWNSLARGLIFDEWDGWRGMRALSGGGEGGELIPAPLSSDVIDLMRSNTPIFQAGATTVPMPSRTYDIARLTADPTATAWHAEAGTITPDSAMALDRVTFTAKTLPVIVKASRELSEDAPNLGQVVRRAIAGAVGVELTRAALRGTGASNSPTGIRSASGVTVTELGAGNGAAASYDTLLDAMQVLETANSMATGVIWTPRTKISLAKLKDSQNNYLKPPPEVSDLPRYTTTVIPTNLTVGATSTCTEIYSGLWSELLIGLRTNLQIKVLDQRYADTGEIAFMAWLRADVQLAHATSFVVNTGVTN